MKENNVDFVEQLKSKNDILKVVASYVQLAESGGKYWACCPFHDEKTPSFMIDPQKQTFKCFSCGISGDVVDFVQMIEKTDKKGAIELLSKRADVQVIEE